MILVKSRINGPNEDFLFGSCSDIRRLQRNMARKLTFYKFYNSKRRNLFREVVPKINMLCPLKNHIAVVV